MNMQSALLCVYGISMCMCNVFGAAARSFVSWSFVFSFSFFFSREPHGPPSKHSKNYCMCGIVTVCVCVCIP